MGKPHGNALMIVYIKGPGAFMGAADAGLANSVPLTATIGFSNSESGFFLCHGQEIFIADSFNFNLQYLVGACSPATLTFR